MKITTHGVMWIKGSKEALSCPECNINQVRFKIEHIPDNLNPTKLIARCVCTNCGCEFQYARDLSDASAE